MFVTVPFWADFECRKSENEAVMLIFPISSELKEEAWDIVYITVLISSIYDYF